MTIRGVGHDGSAPGATSGSGNGPSGGGSSTTVTGGGASGPKSARFEAVALVNERNCEVHDLSDRTESLWRNLNI